MPNHKYMVNLVTPTELHSIAQLTNREYSIFIELGKGKIYKEIAVECDGYKVSEKTVDSFVGCISKRIYGKGKSDRSALRNLACRFTIYSNYFELTREPAPRVRPTARFITPDSETQAFITKSSRQFLSKTNAETVEK